MTAVVALDAVVGRRVVALDGPRAGCVGVVVRVEAPAHWYVRWDGEDRDVGVDTGSIAWEKA